MPPQLQAPQLEAVEDVVFPICGKCAQAGEGWQFPSCGPQCCKVAAPPPPGYPAGPPPPPYEPEAVLHQDQAFIIPDTQNVVKFGLGWSCARNFDMDAAVLLLANSAAPPSGGGSVEAIASLEAPPSAWGHIDPRTNTVQPFSEVDNKLILAAQQRGDSRVRIGDVALPNGAVLHFEVRFNDQGKLTTMPASRMVQVNLGNGNTREIKVLREGPPAALATGGALPPSYDQPRPQLDAKDVAEKLGMYIICREIGEPASAVGE